MKVIMQLLGVAPDGRPPPKATFVRDCDFDADEGRGRIVMTQKQGEAKRFEDVGAALQFYQQTSKVVPIRPDGKPNRPMTAYNIAIMDENKEPT